MLNGKTVVALIPARAGSKRLVNKNVLPLAGIPLIAWSINAAIESQYVDRVVVSTDSADIIKVAKDYGAEIPFIRPAEFATDTSSTVDVILHAIEALKLQGDDILLILQPTSPLRKSKHIDGALQLMVDDSVEGVVSVTTCSHSPLWSNTLPNDGNMGSFIREEIKGKRSQDLPQYYRLNGAIYAFNVSSILKHGSINYSSAVFSYVMPEQNSFDIDTELDFKLCELFVNASLY